MVSLCMLVPEHLELFHSYSILKIVSTISQYWLNMNAPAPKARSLQVDPRTQNRNVLKNSSVLPSFLQREGIYYFPAKSGYSNQEASPPATPSDEMSNMKRRCLACNPQKTESIKVWIWFEHGWYAQHMHNMGKIKICL
jgi:hypothetical protein